MVKKSVVDFLNKRTAAYLRRGKVHVIAVVGSVGKTSSAAAMRTVLAQSYRVHMPQTAYNTDKSIHLGIFNLRFATNPLAWAFVLLRLTLQSLGKPAYSHIVLELGTDRPGDLEKFAWLHPELAVVTAISPEHMEAFGTLDAVAREEFSVQDFAGQLLVNTSSIEGRWMEMLGNRTVLQYGAGSARAITKAQPENDGTQVSMRLNELELNNMHAGVLGDHMLQAVLAGASVGELYDMPVEQLRSGVEAIQPVAGRMQVLAGKQGSTIIDDSYNASPAAVEAALQTMYAMPANKRIAILGSMNELGETSALAHQAVGDLCDPAKLDLVVALGTDAVTYVAPAAKQRGCRVLCADSPYQAGELVADELADGVVVLVKGSQNGVFAEEAIKRLLDNPQDASRLVRQNAYWMAKKQQQFGTAEQQKSDSR